MADEELLRISLTCIGLCVPSEAIGICLIMMQQANPCGIYCVRLTKECTDLVSPLYEHDVSLKASATDDVYHVVENFAGETCYQVVERRGFRYRLDKQYTQKEMTKKMHDFLGHTFFIASEFHHHHAIANESTLFGSFFPNTGAGGYTYFNCVNDQERTTLNTYLLLLGVLREKRQRGRKSMYDIYWDEFAGEHAFLLEPAVAQLFQFAPKDKLYQQRDILALFKGWKAYKRIGQYFTHQALGMDVSYALYQLFAKTTNSIVNPALLPLNARIEMYNFCQFVIKLLKEEQAQKPHSPFTPSDVSVTFLNEYLKGGLYDLFCLCIKQCHMDARIRTAFEMLKQRILLPCLIRKLESLATNRANYNKATLDAVTLHAVYLVYHSLTSINAPLVWPKEEELFEIEMEEEEEDGLPIALSHSLTDFNSVLKMLYSAIKERVHECTSIETHRWQLKETSQSLLIAKSSTVLFFISADLKALALEETNHQLYDQCIHGKASTTIHQHGSLLQPETWQEAFNARRETTENMVALPQEFQFVLFTPTEMKANDDLACLKGLLFEDLFNSVILRETNDWHFHRRVSEYFATEQDSLDMRLFHRERCFATTSFEFIPKEAIKETVFIPHAHLLSLVSMKNLLSWCIIKHRVVKRVVFIGSIDLLATMAHGQAFLDLLRAVSFQSINQALYNYDRATANFVALLEDHWRTMAWIDKENKNAKELVHFYSQETLFQQQRKQISLLYHLKSASILAALLNREPTTKFSLCALYKRPFNPSRRNQNPLHQALTTQFSGGKNVRIVVSSLEIDALAGHNTMYTPDHKVCYVISRRSLFSLDKNQVAMLFTVVDSLYVLMRVEGEFDDKKMDDEDDTSLLDLLMKQFRESRRPNVRYSYTCLTR